MEWEITTVITHSHQLIEFHFIPFTTIAGAEAADADKIIACYMLSESFTLNLILPFHSVSELSGVNAFFCLIPINLNVVNEEEITKVITHNNQLIWIHSLHSFIHLNFFVVERA